MPDWLVAVALPLSAVIAAWIAARVSHRSATYQRIVQLEARVDKFETLRESDLDYIGVLKHHIWTRQGPPPPERPERRRHDKEHTS